MYEKAIAVFRKSSRCGCQSRIADNCESVKDMAIALDNGRKRSWLSPPCRYSLKRTVFDEYTGAGTNPAVCHPVLYGLGIKTMKAQSVDADYEKAEYNKILCSICSSSSVVRARYS